MSDEADQGYLDSVAHALLIQSKIDVLRARQAETMEVVASLAPRATAAVILDGYERLKAADVPGRGLLRADVDRSKVRPAEPGATFRRARGSMDRWPVAPAWVYVLLDHEGTVLYVGKAKAPKNRMRDHNQRIPWEQAELIACASEADALTLEGDLIYQHQPPWNVQDVRRRRYVRQAAPAGGEKV